MHFVYIIYSAAFDKFYVGQSVEPGERVIQHNKGFFKGSSTSYANDRQLKLVLSVITKKDAIKIERYIKSMKSKTFMIKLISDDAFLHEFKRIVIARFKVEIS